MFRFLKTKEWSGPGVSAGLGKILSLEFSPRLKELGSGKLVQKFRAKPAREGLTDTTMEVSFSCRHGLRIGHFWTTGVLTPHPGSFR